MGDVTEGFLPDILLFNDSELDRWLVSTASQFCVDPMVVALLMPHMASIPSDNVRVIRPPGSRLVHLKVLAAEVGTHGDIRCTVPATRSGCSVATANENTAPTD